MTCHPNSNQPMSYNRVKCCFWQEYKCSSRKKGCICQKMSPSLKALLTFPGNLCLSSRSNTRRMKVTMMMRIRSDEMNFCSWKKVWMSCRNSKAKQFGICKIWSYPTAGTNRLRVGIGYLLQFISYFKLIITCIACCFNSSFKIICFFC